MNRRLMTWMGHERVDETLLYVHLAEQHRRAMPEPVRRAGAVELDPGDARRSRANVVATACERKPKAR